MRGVFVSFLFLIHNFVVGRFVVPRFLLIGLGWGSCCIFVGGVLLMEGAAVQEESERERFPCFDDAQSLQNFFGPWVLVRGLGF